MSRWEHSMPQPSLDPPSQDDAHERDIKDLQERITELEEQLRQVTNRAEAAQFQRSELQAAMVRIRYIVERIRKTRGYSEESDWLGPFLHAIEDTTMRPSVRHEVTP